MSQRIRERLYGDEYTASAERFRKAHQTGEYIDGFTTIPPEDAKVTLDRLPKFMQGKGKEDE